MSFDSLLLLIDTFLLIFCITKQSRRHEQIKQPNGLEVLTRVTAELLDLYLKGHRQVRRLHKKILHCLSERAEL